MRVLSLWTCLAVCVVAKKHDEDTKRFEELARMTIEKLLRPFRNLEDKYENSTEIDTMEYEYDYEDVVNPGGVVDEYEYSYEAAVNPATVTSEYEYAVDEYESCSGVQICYGPLLAFLGSMQDNHLCVPEFIDAVTYLFECQVEICDTPCETLESVASLLDCDVPFSCSSSLRH